MWSNQNGHQEPTPNIDERRGSAQRIDRSRASLRQGMFFSHHIIINMEIDGDIMDVILNNQINPVAHGAWSWARLVRWQGSMDQSNTQNTPTQN